MSNQTNFLETFKSGSKRFATLVADTGAKTMLKVRFFVLCVWMLVMAINIVCERCYLQQTVLTDLLVKCLLSSHLLTI
jgi:hypothetical protein